MDADSTQLTFQWSSVSSDCPAIQYHIMSDSCGDCGPNLTNQTQAMCYRPSTDNQTNCTFALETVVCNNITGQGSTSISVTLRGMV